MPVKNDRNRDIAVVGCGPWGRNLVRNFFELGALRSVCDVNSLRLQLCVTSGVELERTTDFTKILSDNNVKGVAIATPAATHYVIAKAALLAGKDVFVEKPLALSSRQGAELVHIAEEQGQILMVGHLLLYHPAIIRLRQLMREGALGDIYSMYSSRLNLGRVRQEENVLWSFASHDISVFLFLMGEMPKSVSAWGRSYLQELVEDETIAILDFPTGVQGHIFVSWLYPQKEQRLTVIGDRGMVVFDDLQPADKLTLYSHVIQRDGPNPAPVQGESKSIEVGKCEPLRLECQHFLDCVLNRREPSTDGRSGLDVLHILEACQSSLQKRGVATSMDNSRKVQVEETAKTRGRS